MKVLDLQCAHQHSFEGWFASEDDFHAQLERGLVSCPLCGDHHIEKKLSAPRLNLRASRQEAPPASTEVMVSDHAARGELTALQSKLLHALREIAASTEDVGERFAEQARAMHHGDIERRNIRGQTTAEVVMELLDEGIDVLPLPDIPAIKDTLQ